MLKLFKKIPVALRWTVVVLLGFLGIFCFVHIDSYWADTHHANWLMWTGGVVCFAIVIFLFIAANNENPKEGKRY